MSEKSVVAILSHLKKIAYLSNCIYSLMIHAHLGTISSVLNVLFRSCFTQKHWLNKHNVWGKTAKESTQQSQEVGIASVTDFVAALAT